MFDKISYYYFNANYEKCLELSESFLEDEPKFALEYASLSSLKLAFFEKSLFYTKQLFDLNPTSFNGLLLAKAYIANLQPNEANHLLNKLIKRNDFLQDELYLELALLLKNMNDLDNAEKIFKFLLQKDLYNLNMWKSYVEIYFKQDFSKALKAHDELCEFALEMIKNLKKGVLVEKNNTKEYNLQERLQAKTKENFTIVKIQDFLNTQILPQKAYLLFKLLRIKESLELFDSLVEANENNAQFWQNYARALEFNSNYQGAYNAYQKALSLHSHATYKFDLAYLLMRMGVSENYEEGKRLYENRLFYAHNETFSLHHYNKSIQAFNKYGIEVFKDKEILVFCEQGFGDTIMYSRCLEKLCKIASCVLFAPQSAMQTMFKNQIKLFNQNDNTFKNVKVLKDFPKSFDYALPICSLPLFMDIKVDEIPKLKTPLIPFEKPQNKKKKIGIFWFTPSASNSDLLRNIDFSLLYESLKQMDFTLVSFQVAGDDVNNLPNDVENRGVKLKSWNDTLESLKDIDCMVSIDSAIAHLSLALNIPTIVLLSPRFDWRWGKYEEPKSYFWPRVKCLILKDDLKVKSQLKEMVKESTG